MCVTSYYQLSYKFKSLCILGGLYCFLSLWQKCKSGIYRLSNHYPYFTKQTQFIQAKRSGDGYRELHVLSPVFCILFSACFLQNEPNFVRRRRIASALMTRRYEDITILSKPENEPKTNPNLCRLGNLGKFHPPKSVNAVCD